MTAVYKGDQRPDTVFQNDWHVYATILTYGGADRVGLLLGEVRVDTGGAADAVTSSIENRSRIVLGSGNDSYTGKGFAGDGGAGDSVAGGVGDDQFRISTHASRYAGGSDDDLFLSIGSANELYGGIGSDTVSYRRQDADPLFAGRGIMIDLTQGTATSGPGMIETLSGIENATGTSFADRVTGSVTANVLIGLGGDDVIDGGAGDDNVQGRIGNDTVLGGTGNDYVDGGQGNDYLVGGEGQDSYRGGTGADVFAFVSILDSAVGQERDIVPRMKKWEGNLVDVSAIDAVASGADDAFDYLWKKDFTGTAGELRFSNYVLQADIDGDKVADFEVWIAAARMRTIDLIL
jgi:serralysin